MRPLPNLKLIKTQTVLISNYSRTRHWSLYHNFNLWTLCHYCSMITRDNLPFKNYLLSNLKSNPLSWLRVPKNLLKKPHLKFECPSNHLPLTLVKCTMR